MSDLLYIIIVHNYTPTNTKVVPTRWMSARIDREALTVAEVLIGLPPEVIDLVAARSMAPGVLLRQTLLSASSTRRSVSALHSGTTWGR